MKPFNQKSFLLVSSNQYCGKEAGWNVVDGTAITIDEGFVSHRVQQGMGKDKKGLGTWVYSIFRGKGNQHF